MHCIRRLLCGGLSHDQPITCIHWCIHIALISSRALSKSHKYPSHGTNQQIHKNVRARVHFGVAAG